MSSSSSGCELLDDNQTIESISQRLPVNGTVKFDNLKLLGHQDITCQLNISAVWLINNSSLSGYLGLSAPPPTPPWRHLNVRFDQLMSSECLIVLSGCSDWFDRVVRHSNTPDQCKSIYFQIQFTCICVINRLTGCLKCDFG